MTIQSREIRNIESFQFWSIHTATHTVRHTIILYIPLDVLIHILPHTRGIVHTRGALDVEAKLHEVAPILSITEELLYPSVVMPYKDEIYIGLIGYSALDDKGNLMNRTHLIEKIIDEAVCLRKRFVMKSA